MSVPMIDNFIWKYQFKFRNKCNEQLKFDFQVFDPQSNGLVPFVDEVETFNATFNIELH